MTLVFAWAALSATGTAALAEPELIAPDSNWAIHRESCTLDGGWDGGRHQTALFIEPIDDHYHVSVMTTQMGGVRAQAAATIDIGIDQRPAERTGLVATGYISENRYRGYIIEADDALVRSLAAEGTIQFYRNNRLLADINLLGAAPAIAAMLACAAESPERTDAERETGDHDM